MCDPMDGDENPITIDTAEHNHLQLLLCVNELREHTGRSEALLSQVNHYIREQESTYQSKLEEERKHHQQTKQQLAATLRKLADVELLYENLASRNRKLELILGNNGEDEETRQNGTGKTNNITATTATPQISNGVNSLSAIPPKEKSYRFSLKAISWSEKSRKRKSAPPGKNLQEEIRLELKFIQEVASVKIQAVVKGFIVRQRYKKMLIMNSKRNNIVREIFETEKSYVRNITVIVKTFLRPLRNSGHDGATVLEVRSINYIFSVIDQVLVAHDILMTMMERRLKKWSPFQKFGDIFLKDYMNNFQSVYSTYINNYNRAFVTLNKCLNENKNFAQFVKQAEARKECEMHDLLSFLIMPIQRIPRYKLLLLDLLKNTWETHIDYSDIRSAVLKITEIASMLNENKRESESSSSTFLTQSERERKEREREAASRSLKRNTAILEDLSAFLKNTSTWSDSENDSSPIGSPIPERVTPAEVTEAQLDELMMRMLSGSAAIPTGKNTYHLRVYEQSFPGASLMSWLAEYYPHLPRDKLMGLSQMLMDRGVVTTIKTDQKYFRDSKTTLYRFKIADKKEQTLNIPKQWVGPAVRDPVSIANAMAVITVDTVGKFLMPDKKSVNFAKLVESPEFLALCLQTSELQRVEISHLSPKQKLVFFVNVHNALLVHAHATIGPPKSVTSVKGLADRCNYVISGHKYSIEDLEQLILGGTAHFKKKSSKLQNIVPSSARDFMTIFPLATGTMDAPPIVAYDFDTFDSQVEGLASQFLQSQVEIKLGANEVWLPYILWNRKSDVWKDHKELVSRVLPLLKESQRADLTKMMADKGKVEFKWRMHTWIPNYVIADPPTPIVEEGET